MHRLHCSPLGKAFSPQRPPARLLLSHCRPFIRRSLLVRAFGGAPSNYSDLKSSADGAYNKAKELLPALQEALSIAQSAREPAAEAERLWQDAHQTLSEVQAHAHSALDELRAGTMAALGGSEHMAQEMLRHHAHHRLQTYTKSLSDVTHWQMFNPTIEHLAWLPGSTMVSQLAACQIDGAPYLITCVALAPAPMDQDALRAVMLHWGVADTPNSGWAGIIPQGWHTSPSVSQPFGKTAWETGLATFAPVMQGEVMDSVEVFSVVIQIPLEGSLAVKGGMKYVLKRTDGGQPEWIKPWHDSDFWLDFQPAIDYFEYIRQQDQLVGMRAAAAAAAGKAGEGSSSMDDWDLTRNDADADDWDFDNVSNTTTGSSAVLPDVQFEQAQVNVMSSQDGEEVVFSFTGQEDAETNRPWENQQQDSQTTTPAEAFSSSESSELLNDGTETQEHPSAVPAPTTEISETDPHEDKAKITLMEWQPPQLVPLPGGWLSGIERWEFLPDHPPHVPKSLSQQLQHLKAVLRAAEQTATTVTANDNNYANVSVESQSEAEAAPDESGMSKEQAQPDLKEAVGKLLQRCDEVGDSLHQHDSAALTARAAQQEKEKLWEAHKSASVQATHLQAEINAALELARKAAVALRGRTSEITSRDLEGLCYRMASEGKKERSGIWPFGGSSDSRKMVYVNQQEMQISGMPASLVAQVYLEGPAAAVDALLTSTEAPDEKEEHSTSTATQPEDSNSSKDGKEKEKEKKPKAVLDTVVITIAAAEAFPDSKLAAPVLLHFGCVPHHGGKWCQPPEGWKSSPEALPAAANNSGDGLPWSPLQRYTLTGAEGAGPVLVDPELQGVCIKLPLKECVTQRVRGFEFVLKTRDEKWLSWDKGHGTPVNFYIDLPIPTR